MKTDITVKELEAIVELRDGIARAILLDRLAWGFRKLLADGSFQ